MAVAKMEKALLDKIREQLAELGGRAFADDDIVYGDSKQMVIPKGMNFKDAINFLARKIEEEQEVTEFSRKLPFRPWDGAYCAYHALKEAFGAVLLKGSGQGFFSTPPQMISIETDFDSTEQIPWGEFQVPALPDVTFSLGSTRDEELGIVFIMAASGPKKYAFEIEGVFRLIETRLREHSIYKGKAIDGKQMPSFLDLTAVDPEKVVYNEVTGRHMDANINSLLKYSAEMRKHGVPLKRSVLLFGPYGTGKTLAGFLTAQEAVRNGWGFIYVRPGKDNWVEALQTARIYSPSVVFFEDVDVIANPENLKEDGLSQLLDEFDGITAKGTEVIIVMTTNHPDRLHKGMLRPGRLDAVIEISYLDDDNIEKLTRQVLDPNLLAADVDWEKVRDSMRGFTPAFVREAADRAFRYAITQNGGTAEGVQLDTLDFEAAADSLRKQLQLMEDAPETTDRDPLSATLGTVVANSVAEIMVDEFGFERN